MVDSCSNTRNVRRLQLKCCLFDNVIKNIIICGQVQYSFNFFRKYNLCRAIEVKISNLAYTTQTVGLLDVSFHAFVMVLRFTFLERNIKQTNTFRVRLTTKSYCFKQWT